MRISQTVAVFLLGISAAAVYAQGAPAATPTQQPAAQAPPAAAPGVDTAASAAPPAITASSLLQPALTQCQAALSTLKTDRWKKGSVRDEASQNISALLRDLRSNIPPLVTAADAEPTALSRAIPLMKHLDAFYDVLLRVEEAARVSAPGDQVSTLQQTLLDVNKARNAYDDQMQAYAATTEKQVFDLQTQVRTQQSAAAQAKAASPVTEPCKPATPAHKNKRATPSSKPAAGTPAASTPQ
jgi:hypothetical protein